MSTLFPPLPRTESITQIYALPYTHTKKCRPLKLILFRTGFTQFSAS